MRIPPDLQLLNKIESMVVTVLGDIHGKPKAPDQLMASCGISESEYSKMNSEEQLETMLRVLQVLESQPTPPTRTENLIAALDLIFQAIYGDKYKKRSAADLTLSEAFLALEHATEFDSQNRPSIWDL